MQWFILGCLFVVCFYMLLCIILHGAVIYFRLFVCCLLLYVVAVVLHVWNDTVISHNGMNIVSCVLYSVLSAFVETITLPASQSVGKCCGIWGVRGWVKGPSLFDGGSSQRWEMEGKKERRKGTQWRCSAAAWLAQWNLWSDLPELCCYASKPKVTMKGVTESVESLLLGK